MYDILLTYLDNKLYDSSQYVTLPEKTTALYRIPANTTKLYKKSCKKMSTAVKICRNIEESLLLCQTLSKVWGFLSKSRVNKCKNSARGFSRGILLYFILYPKTERFWGILKGQKKV